MPEEPKPKLDAFTAKVVGDPSNPQETLLLQGFLGSSSEDKHTRVYTDVTLDTYIDVANADIIHSEQLPKDQSPFGGSFIWVKKAADVLQGKAGAERKKAKFLEGPIAAEAAGAVGTGIGTSGINTQVVLCHPTIIVQACRPTPVCPPTPLHHCPPPLTPFCPTRLTYCVPITVNQHQCVASGGPGCGVYTPETPQIGPIGEVGQFQAQAFAAPAIPPSNVGAQCITSASVCACPTQVAAICHPTLQNCPSVHGYHCPSVASYQCPSVAGYQCPSVAGYQCASVHNYHCPSVANYQCQTITGPHCQSVACTDIGPHCNPTPNPQHCPTPNMMCPHPTTTFQCPSVGEVCATSSELFCFAAHAAAQPAGQPAAAPVAGLAPVHVQPSAYVACHPTIFCPVTVAAHNCPVKTIYFAQCYTPYCPIASIQGCPPVSLGCPWGGGGGGYNPGY